MLIFDQTTYLKSKFRNEEELESVVLANFEYLFGPDSIFLPKALIKTTQGSGTIPDGFAIDLAKKKWYIVEAELLHHGVWAHIVPQVTKQLIASNNPESKTTIQELAVIEFEGNPIIQEKFEALGISHLHVRRELREILEGAPTISIPIDETSKDLTDWAITLGFEVVIWEIEKFVHQDNPEQLIYSLPDDFAPSFNSRTNGIGRESSASRNHFPDTIRDLMDEGLIMQGDELSMTYKKRGKKPQAFKAIVQENGFLNVLNQSIQSPSRAAVLCIQETGSQRQTANGWTSWSNKKGQKLSDLREILFERRIGNQDARE
ncbi:hypothetical protein N9098_01070 [bacterium]|nr:hypothetical protein [bacterium]